MSLNNHHHRCRRRRRCRCRCRRRFEPMDWETEWNNMTEFSIYLKNFFFLISSNFSCIPYEADHANALYFTIFFKSAPQEIEKRSFKDLEPISVY